MIKILIITHGELGMEMIKTAELIVGKQEDVETLSLTQMDSLAGMCKRVEEELSKIKSEEGILILTDMLGGTPCNACLPFCKDYNIEIITGLNLYMLISAFISRGQLRLPDLASKILSDGQKNIANAKEIFLKKLK
ncbi:MAG: hypothetical protein JW803_04710 [Endomicrobiales bacterium]|nr:hypothetical protein [Endomicrobiales bacterium]